MIERRHPKIAFVVVVGATTLLASGLHGFEAGIWALAYQFLGAIRDSRAATLYSLNAITSCGHTDLALQDHCHLMGSDGGAERMAAARTDNRLSVCSN